MMKLPGMLIMCLIVMCICSSDVNIVVLSVNLLFCNQLFGNYQLAMK